MPDLFIYSPAEIARSSVLEYFVADFIALAVLFTSVLWSDLVPVCFLM